MVLAEESNNHDDGHQQLYVPPLPSLTPLSLRTATFTTSKTPLLPTMSSSTLQGVQIELEREPNTTVRLATTLTQLESQIQVRTETLYSILLAVCNKWILKKLNNRRKKPFSALSSHYVLISLRSNTHWSRSPRLPSLFLSAQSTQNTYAPSQRNPRRI